MSPARMDIPRLLRLVISFCLEGSEEEIVNGRRRTVIVVVDGAFEAREVRTAVPSSPAPRTRILDAISEE